GFVVSVAPLASVGSARASGRRRGCRPSPTSSVQRASCCGPSFLAAIGASRFFCGGSGSIGGCAWFGSAYARSAHAAPLPTPHAAAYESRLAPVPPRRGRRRLLLRHALCCSGQQLLHVRGKLRRHGFGLIAFLEQTLGILVSDIDVHDLTHNKRFKPHHERSDW